MTAIQLIRIETTTGISTLYVVTEADKKNYRICTVNGDKHCTTDYSNSEQAINQYLQLIIVAISLEGFKILKGIHNVKND